MEMDYEQIGSILDNNNPGALKVGKHLWPGESLQPAGGFAVFDSIEDGYRAMAHVLSYYFKKGRNTPTKIIKGTNGSNGYSATDQDTYINYISSHLGIGPNDPITPNHDNFYNLMLIMSSLELGPDADQVTDQEIEDGLTMAEQDKPGLYTVASGAANTGGQSNTPAQQQSQPRQSPNTANAQIPKIPGVTDVMKSAGFGQGAIDFFHSTGFGWVEVGIGTAIVLLILRPFD